MKLFNKHVISLLLVLTLLLSTVPMAAFSAGAADTCSDGHNYGRIVNSVAHMGYSHEAPENTLPSYRLAKEKGFFYVECDVTYTSDGVPVLHHLETIDSTSNGTGKVTQMTYNQLLKYDFGSWKNSKYVGTKIPTFEEFIALCAQLGLHPYIELKDHGNHTRESLGELVDIVEKYGMLRQCTWITFIHDYFFYINEFDPQARVGLLWPYDINSSIINKAASIKTSTNEVFLDVNYETLTNSGIQRAKSNGFPVEVYTVDDKNTMLNANSYISGFTSNYVVAQSVIGKPNATVTDPDCLRQGYTTYTCNDCGYTYRDNYVGIVDHNYDSNGVCKTCGFKTEGFTYYVYDAANGGNDSNNGNSPNSPIATFDKAIQLAKNAGANSDNTVTLNIKGNVNWGGNIYSNGISTNWEVLTSHDFKVVVNSVDGTAVLGDGAKHIMFGGEIEFNNIKINPGNNWKSLVFAANNTTFNNTFSSDMFDLVLGTRAVHTVDKATTFTFNNYRPKIFVGNSYKTITYNQKFTLNLAADLTGTIGNTLLVMAASDGKTIYNAGADIITSTPNTLSFSNADRVDIGTIGYLNIINNASGNIIDINSIGLSNAAMSKTWVLNIDSDETLKSTSKAGVFEIPKYFVAIAESSLGGKVTSVANKLTIPAGQHKVTITVCTSHIYDNNKDTDCNICGAVREILPCDHTYSNACDSTCNECGEERDVPDHIYDNACDTNCNVCGATRAVTHSYKWVVDKAENCGENGTKHQECTVCGEKKDENTTIPATNAHTYTNACDKSCDVCGNERVTPEHNYILTNGKVACSVCSEIYNYTGIWQNSNNTYYLADGIAKNGWQSVDGDWYYFDAETYNGISGTKEFAPVEYEFQNGKLLSGVWAKTLFGTRYYYGPNYYESGWQNINGSDYCFENGYRLSNGWQLVYEDSNGANWYYFDANGVCQDKSLKPQDGFYTDRNGYSYSQNGKAPKGITEIDGNYYYFSREGYAQKNGTYSGYLFKNEYTAYTGILEKDGGLCLYIDGRTSVMGLFEIDGDYYFADWGGVIKTNDRYYVGTSYCDLPAGMNYTFGADGKMLDGIVETEEGLLLYIDGTTSTKGLFKVDNDYYFADWGGVVKTDGRYYISDSYCDLPARMNYTFGADGKMLDGIVETEEGLFFYIDGTTSTKGLFKVDDDYYFADWGGVVKTDGRYYVSDSYCDLPAGMNYTFGADGKMLDGIVETEEGLLLYIDGTTSTKGLFKVDNDYYFADWGGVVKTDGRYYVSDSYCDLPAGMNYTFGADGKMLDGIVETEEGLLLYIDGTTSTKGLFKVDNDYYFVDWGGVVKTDGRYYISDSYCDLPAGMNYTFGADGKMLNGIVEIDNGLYLYINGTTSARGLFKIGEDYYFADWGGTIRSNGKYYVSETYCDLAADVEYTFGADGKMLNGFVTKDDGIYYYQNGIAATPGIIEVEGNYYFAHTNGKLITSQTFYVYEGNGYTICMEYTFDKTGKIIA